MAVIPSASLRTATLDAWRESVEGGTLELLSAANQVLVVFQLAADAGDVAGDDWALDFFNDEANGAAAAGLGTNAAAGRIKNASGAVTVSGLTVTLTSGNGDIKMINTSITEGQRVIITSAVLRYPGV